MEEGNQKLPFATVSIFGRSTAIHFIVALVATHSFLVPSAWLLLSLIEAQQFCFVC